MLYSRILLTRFIAMVLVLLLGACSYQNLGPDNGTVQPGQATAIWEAVATQTAQFGQATAQPSGSPAATTAAQTPGAGSTSQPGTGGVPQATTGAGSTLPAPAATRLPGTPAGAAEGPPQVVLQGRQWLSQQLNEPLDTVVIQRFEQVQWPDTCLGLGQTGASCAQVVTPGWRIVLYANGQNYEVRTDASGQILRMVVGGKG